MKSLTVTDEQFYNILYALACLAQDCQDNAAYSESDKFESLRLELLQQGKA